MYGPSNNRKRGFLTAGHLAIGYPTAIYYGGKQNEITPVYMGSIRALQQTLGNVDACIIEADSTDTFNFTGKTLDNRLIIAQRTAPLPNQTNIYAYGAGSKKALSGQVTDNAYSWYVTSGQDWILCYDFYGTSLSTTNGDSGGPVVYSYNNDYSFVGIIQGKMSGVYTVCPIQNINAAFNSSVSQ